MYYEMWMCLKSNSSGKWRFKCIEQRINSTGVSQWSSKAVCFSNCIVLCFSCSVNRFGENRLHQQTNSSLLFSHQTLRGRLPRPPYTINLVRLRVRGEMDWHLTSETFWLPIFLLMPREPTLAKPHDRQPIKEYNDSPTPLCPPSPPPKSLSLSFSPSALWLIPKLTCLSSAAAFQLKWPAQ